METPATYTTEDAPVRLTADEYVEQSHKKWNKVTQALDALYRAWASSAVPWHEETNALMQAYDEWLD